MYAVWQLHEDVAIAAMTCGEVKLAYQCWLALNDKFPKSVRVECLRGMLLEANGEQDSAAEVYDAVVEKHPANTTARRRQVRMHRLMHAVRCFTRPIIDELSLMSAPRQLGCLLLRIVVFCS
jgi:predicted Zn-dependent protease